MRYKISEHIKFTTAPKNVQSKTGSTLFLISDDRNKRQFLINETTKTFLDKFSVLKSFSELNKEIAKEVNASAGEVKKLVQPFFKYIKYRHFIVPENYVPGKTELKSFFDCGVVVNQYKIEEIIDVNSNLDIYKATDLNTAKKVIIKLLKHPKQEDIDELKREYNFLKSLSKTNIAPGAYAFVTSNKFAYFSQDFIAGLSLPQFISRKKNSSPNLILLIVENILQAFNKIHTENIIHGDIHPGNIIVTPHNTIKIIDFGLALNNELDKDELVNFGGAYFFMPPERISKTTSKKFTRKPCFYSDVFQLGVVLYMLLYDEYPFNGLTWEELATEIKEKQVEFPSKSKYNFLVPEQLKNIIAKCIAKKPKHRFANAKEIYYAFSKSIKDARKIRSAVKI